MSTTLGWGWGGGLVWERAYGFDGGGALGQTSDVDLGLHFAVNRCEETLGAVDTHYGFLADLHADAALQLIHGNLGTIGSFCL